MATLNSHGLEPQEEAIMDLWDEGLSLDQIAARLNVPVSRVAFVARTFADTCPSDRWAIHARMATAALATALARAT